MNGGMKIKIWQGDVTWLSAEMLRAGAGWRIRIKLSNMEWKWNVSRETSFKSHRDNSQNAFIFKIVLFPEFNPAGTHEVGFQSVSSLPFYQEEPILAVPAPAPTSGAAWACMNFLHCTKLSNYVTFGIHEWQALFHSFSFFSCQNIPQSRDGCAVHEGSNVPAQGDGCGCNSNTI